MSQGFKFLREDVSWVGSNGYKGWVREREKEMGEKKRKLKVSGLWMGIESGYEKIGPKIWGQQTHCHLSLPYPIVSRPTLEEI